MSGVLCCVQDAERESVEMQMMLEKSQDEKKRLINSLVEAESVLSISPSLSVSLCLSLVRSTQAYLFMS